jgi:hypothetical protein
MLLRCCDSMVKRCYQLLLELARVHNRNFALGRTAVGSLSLDFLDKLLSFDNFPKDNMTTIKPRCLNSSNKELRSVGVGSRVGHGQVHGSFMLQLEILIVKLAPVDRFSSTSIKIGEITSLNHEIGNDSVEDGSLEMKRLSRFSNSLLTGAQGPKVLGSLGDVLSEQSQDDASLLTAFNFNIEKDFAGDFDLTVSRIALIAYCMCGGVLFLKNRDERL